MSFFFSPTTHPKHRNPREVFIDRPSPSPGIDLPGHSRLETPRLETLFSAAHNQPAAFSRSTAERQGKKKKKKKLERKTRRAQKPSLLQSSLFPPTFFFLSDPLSKERI